MKGEQPKEAATEGEKEQPEMGCQKKGKEIEKRAAMGESPREQRKKQRRIGREGEEQPWWAVE